MKTLPFILAAIVTVIGIGVLPTFADQAEDDNTIHGRSPFALEADLRERGVIVSAVEEWGGLIRAWVPNGDGGVAMVFFDADSLQRVSGSLN